MRKRINPKVTVRMKTSNASNYFTVVAPGADSALFNSAGSADGAFVGKLPSSGSYKVQAYLMRNAARRNATASYKLEISVK